MAVADLGNLNASLEQKVIERTQALRDGDETLRSILEATLDSYWRVDAEGRLLDVNQAYCRQSGYSRDELLQRRIVDLEAAESKSNISQRKQAELALRESESRVKKKLNAILDHAGNVLIAVGWQGICTRFHRVHPQMCLNCRESDTLLSDGVEPGSFKFYRCKNNLWDVVTPLLVGERHVGNLFSGQFFLVDDEISPDVFRQQTRRYGLDESEHMAALERVPRINAAMSFFKQLAQTISQLSYSNIKLAPDDRHQQAQRRARTTRPRTHRQSRSSQCIADLGQTPSGCRQPRQERLPHQHEPRDSHADERHHWHGASDPAQRHQRGTGLAINRRLAELMGGETSFSSIFWFTARVAKTARREESASTAAPITDA